MADCTDDPMTASPDRQARTVAVPVDVSAPVTALVPPTRDTRIVYVLRTLLAPLRLTPTVTTITSSKNVRLSWPEHPDQFVEFDAERLHDVFETISGRREEKAPRDHLGRIGAAALGIDCSRPVISQWSWEIAGALAAIEPSWRPPAKRLTVYLTHDIDRVWPFELIGMFGRITRAGKSLCFGNTRPAHDLARWVVNGSSFFRTFDTIMRLERQAGAVGTYFFMSGPYSLRRYGSRAGRSWNLRKVLRMLRQYGHRAGLHGCVYSLQRDNYAQQCHRLAEATGDDIRWHRNHYLIWDGMRSPAALSKAGILIDSTCGFYDTNGFRAGLAHAYRLWDWQADEPSDIREIPLVFMDAACGLPTEQEWAQLYDRLKAAAAVGGTVAILFHLDYFVGNPNGIRRYEQLLRWLNQQNAVLAENPTPLVGADHVASP